MKKFYKYYVNNNLDPMELEDELNEKTDAGKGRSRRNKRGGRGRNRTKDMDGN